MIQKYSKNGHGFTLAEVLVILGIITAVALIVAPVIGRFSLNLELNNSTKELVSYLKLAQQYTVTQQIRYSVKIDLLDHAYYLVKKEPVEEVILLLTMDNNVIFSSVSELQNNEVVFNPSGAADYSGEIEVTHLQSNQKNIIYIKPSGYVTWQKIVQ